jgi:nucleotide-binding universal stress UspA family protein
MSKTTKILLPVDFSEPSANAFRYTLELANQIGASIEILNVIFPEGESMDYPILVAKATETRLEIARDRLNKFIKKELTGMREVLQKEPILSTNLEIGTPVQSICSVAKRNDMSLIILGSRGENRSGIESLIGSVAAGVVGKCQCPVIVIPESAEFKPIQNLTYATDVQDSDPFKIWQAQKLLDPFTPDVNIVHINLKKEGNRGAYEKMEKMKEFFEDRKSDFKCEFHNIPGKDLQKELNEFVETNDTDLLVMHQSHHGFWDRLFFKSNTKNMALHTSVPLLIQKG